MKLNIVLTRILKFSTVIALSSLLPACHDDKLDFSKNMDNNYIVYGNNIIIKKEFSLNSFQEINAQNMINVIYRQAPKYAIEIVAEENIMPFIKFRVNNDTLILNMANSYYSAHQIVEIIVYSPNLKNIQISSNSSFHADKIVTQDLTVLNKGNANIVIDNLQAQNVVWRNEGLSKTQIAGRVDNMKLESFSLSQINWTHLAINNLDIKMSGLGTGKFLVKKSVMGSISGSSSVKIEGEIKLNNLTREGLAEINKGLPNQI